MLANDLALFAQVMDAGGFSRAAERLGLPKSTLSRRIAALETELGGRLLLRGPRRLLLTELGEGILEHARRLLEESTAAVQLAQSSQATPHGTLRVSFPPDFIEMALLPFLFQFTARYPEVRLELDVSPRRVDLLSERYDLAIRVAARLPDDSTLVARRLADLPGGLYASPTYLARRGTPATPADLAGHVGLALLDSRGEAQPWTLSQEAARWEGMPPAPLVANSMSLLRQLADQGMGIVGLAEAYAAPLLHQGRLARVLPHWRLPTVSAWCVTPGRRLLPARTQAFIGMLQAALAAPAA